MLSSQISRIEETPKCAIQHLVISGYFQIKKNKNKINLEVFTSNEEIIIAANAELDKLKKHAFEDCF